MPPRKSDARRSDASVVVAAPATATPAPDDADDDEHTPDDGQPASADKRDKDHKEKEAVSIEDLALPKSIITRLAKGVLPPNTQIQANAILAMSKGATVFISYLASHANEHTTNGGKKTISPADVLKALDDTEFSFLREPLEAEFAKFNAVQTEKRSSYRQKVRAAKAPDADPATAEEPAAPRAKRPRVDAEDDDDDALDADDDALDAEEPRSEEEEEEDDDEEDDDGAPAADDDADETQDALDDRPDADDADEALDADDSD